MIITCPHCGEFIEDTNTTTIHKKDKLTNFGHFSRKENKNHVENGTISPVRINNIVKAFKFIEWDKDSTKITVMGFGDRPAFTIDGVFKKHDGVFRDIKVQYHTFTPGGGESRLYFWVHGKRYKIGNASFIYAHKITLKMLAKYHRLWGKEYKFDAHQSGYGYLFNK